VSVANLAGNPERLLAEPYGPARLTQVRVRPTEIAEGGTFATPVASAIS
jgi:hypothetical protein